MNRSLGKSANRVKLDIGLSCTLITKFLNMDRKMQIVVDLVPRSHDPNTNTLEFKIYFVSFLGCSCNDSMLSG